MHRYLHEWASPAIFYRRAGRLIPWLWLLAACLLGAGLVGGLILAPTHYEQGEVYRIIYVHVPSAWMGMFVYSFMAGAAAIGFVWRVKLAEVVARESAPLGAAFTALALASGSLWGARTWGAWWVWDARLTSVLILFFLYIGFMALQLAIEDRRKAARAGAILALVGIVNIPIIHYSVVWWNTLHQGATVSKASAPSMTADMLTPLLLMAAGFMAYFAAAVLSRSRCEILERERNRHWVKEVIGESLSDG
ncbi:MAG: heme ABC transporter permease [Pseudomonadota bacterium]|nr:heme ABC transporter permease [Pseudomonadota bacterium]